MRFIANTACVAMFFWCSYSADLESQMSLGTGKKVHNILLEFEIFNSGQLLLIRLSL